MYTVLTIRQPWIQLIIAGDKTIEVRTRRTFYRGQLWLHAALRYDQEAFQRLNLTNSSLPRGMLLARCHLDDCFEFDETTWEQLRPFHRNYARFAPPLFGWSLSDVQAISPIPLRGRLGLFHLRALPQAAS